MNRGILVVAALVTATLLVSSAGIVVLNNLDVSLTAMLPPVYFKSGTNANQTGLEGHTITVQIFNKGAAAAIETYIPNGTVYILDALRVVNGTQTNTKYYVTLYVDSQTQSDLNTYFSEAKVFLINPITGSTALTLDMLSNAVTNATGGTYVKLPAASTYGTTTVPGNFTVAIKLVPKASAWNAAAPAQVSFTLYLEYSTNPDELSQTLP